MFENAKAFHGLGVDDLRRGTGVLRRARSG